jgi:membrane protein YdbS with pleckstrin-like domain
MYKHFRDWAEKVLRIPPPPEHPPGDEHTTQVFHAAPNFYKYLLATWALRAAGLLVPAGGAIALSGAGGMLLMQKGKPWGGLLLVVSFLVLGGFVALQLFALAVVRLDFEKRWYVITDRSLRIREGIINLREMTVNFANIQNISISQGPLQRLLALADLRVDTAGGGGDGQEHSHQNEAENLHTAFFRGINNAAEVRALIQDRIKHLKDSGLGDHEELGQPVARAGSSRMIEILREIESEARGLKNVLGQTIGM